MITTTTTRKEYTTTLSEIFTPVYDRFTGGDFRGNHRDMMVIFNRKRDALSITTLWNRGFGGMFGNRVVENYNISTMLEGFKNDAEEMNLAFFCEDNIPQGVSYPH
jgi:hypothetical protein